MLKVYCDTNVYVDMLRNRSDNLRPLGTFAHEFFADGWNCRFDLIVSDHLVNELKKQLNEKEYEELFDVFRKRNKFIFVNEKEGDWERARKMSSNVPDALHAILAQRAGADMIVTRDDDFKEFNCPVKVSLPEHALDTF